MIGKGHGRRDTVDFKFSSRETENFRWIFFRLSYDANVICHKHVFPFFMIQLNKYVFEVGNIVSAMT